MQLATYRTWRGAERYAHELTKAEKHRGTFTFRAVTHPYDFAWSVGVYRDSEFVAYAGKRPPGGPRERYATDSDGCVHGA